MYGVAIIFNLGDNPLRVRQHNVSHHSLSPSIHQIQQHVLTFNLSNIPRGQWLLPPFMEKEMEAYGKLHNSLP